MGKIDCKALALALGITWSFGMLILGWVAALGWGTEAREVLSSFYIGYTDTFFGGIIGAIWGFFDGAIGGYVIGFLYNLFLKTPKKVKKG